MTACVAVCVIAQVAHDAWVPECKSQFGGEPIFVPKVGAQKEDDGYLLVLMYDAKSHKSYLAILDASNLQQGPVTKLRMPHHLTAGLHGSWSPA